MTQYLIATGHDVAQGSLSAIVPQPYSPDGVQCAQRDHAADGSIFERGLHIWLLWRSAGRAANLQTLLGQFTLDTNLRAAVTIYAPDFEREWHRYNGYAVRPRTPNYGIFARDIRILVRDLVKLA